MPKVLFAYRTAIHESTKFSPFHLIYGRSPTLPIDVYHGRTNSYEGFSSYLDNVHEMHKVLGDSYATVRQNLSQAHGRCKNLHDHSANTSEFQCGDRVWLYIPAVKQGRSKKFSSLWRGPYTVIDKTNSVNYWIQLIGISRSLVIHYNRLKLCYGEPEPSSHLTRSGRNRSDNERPATSTPDGSVASNNGLVDFNSSDNQASAVGGYASSSLPGIVLSDNQASAVGGYASLSLPGLCCLPSQQLWIVVVVVIAVSLYLLLLPLLAVMNHYPLLPAQGLDGFIIHLLVTVILSRHKWHQLKGE